MKSRLFRCVVMCVVVFCALDRCAQHLFAKLPYQAAWYDQAGFALGTFQLNVIFIESDPGAANHQENWTPQQLAHVQSEVDQTVAIWEGFTADFHQNAKLDISVNYVNNAVPINVNYEPITMSSSSDQLWINEAMSSLNYNSGSDITRVRNFNRDSRVAAETNWVGTVFVVNDFVDEDNKFSNGFFAYANLGGPFIVTTYGNNGWGEDRFHNVLAHEFGHLFYALDEYLASNQRNTSRAGYLNVLNGNAERNGAGQQVTPPQPDALMLNVEHPPSDWSLGQFGLWDSDNDSIPDILDTFPVLEGDDSATVEGSNIFVFDGSVTVNPLDNQNPRTGFSNGNSGSDMTINWIDDASYKVDNGAWQSFAAADGDYDDYTETLHLELAGLSSGNHQIMIRGINSVGNSSGELVFAFHVPEPSTFLIALFGVMMVGYYRSAGRC